MIHKSQELKTGEKYLVTHNENGRQVKATRIFKWPTSRFENLLCFVFTSKVDKRTTATVKGDKLTISGKRIPRQEVSIPIYDLVSFSPVN